MAEEELEIVDALVSFGARDIQFRCVRKGFIGPEAAVTLRLRFSDLPQRTRVVKGETRPELYSPAAEELHAHLDKLLPVLQDAYAKLLAAPPTRAEVHQAAQARDEAERVAEERYRAATDAEAATQKLAATAAQISKVVEEQAALCEVRRAEVAVLDAIKVNRLREIEALRGPADREVLPSEPEKPVKFGLGDRVKRPGDPKHTGIVVRVEHKSEEGDHLHHVEWVSGPASSGTYWFRDLVSADSLADPPRVEPVKLPELPQERHPLNTRVRAANALPNDTSYGRVMGHSVSPKGYLHHVTWTSGHVSEGTYLYRDLVDLDAATSPVVEIVEEEDDRAIVVTDLASDNAITGPPDDPHERVTHPGESDEDDGEDELS